MIVRIDDGLWPKSGGVNIMQKLFPLVAPIKIGAGVLEAANKLYTKHSVHGYTPLAAVHSKNANISVWRFSPDGILQQSFSVSGEVSIDLLDGQIAIIEVQS